MCIRDSGYWRGPIWAPTTALFVDALLRSDRAETAAEVALRYLSLIHI